MIGPIKHGPLWRRALLIVVGLLIFCLAVVFMLAEGFPASNALVQGIVSFPVWFRLLIGCLLAAAGPLIAVYGWLS
jgi:hypothetical protein